MKIIVGIVNQIYIIDPKNWHHQLKGKIMKHEFRYFFIRKWPDY